MIGSSGSSRKRARSRVNLGSVLLSDRQSIENKGGLMRVSLKAVVVIGAVHAAYLDERDASRDVVIGLLGANHRRDALRVG